MYCKKCGKLLDAGDKFCSNCGTRVAEDFVPAFRREEPQETPRTAQSPEQPEERAKRKFHIEEFNWDLDGYPTARKKTEDVDFNWSSVLEEKRRDVYGTPKTESQEAEDGAAKAGEEAGEEASLEETIFADMGSLDSEDGVDNEEPTRILGHRETRTEFYTYNKKNEALQAMLDKEYEKLRSGEEPEEEPGVAGAGDGRSPEQVMAELLEKTEPAAGSAAEGQEAGGQPENPPSKKEEKVAVEFVGVVLSGAPKGIVVEAEDEPAGPRQDKTAAAAGTETGKPAAETETARAETPQPESAKTEPTADAEAEAKAGADDGETAGKAAESRESRPPREEKKEEHKLTFDDVFGDDDDSEESPKKGKVLKVIAIILCILVAAELVVIGIQYFAPQSEAARVINKAYGSVMDLFSGKEDAGEQEPAAEPQEEEEGPLAALIAEQKGKGKNIVLIEEDQSLTFADGEDYGFEDFGSAYTFADKPWYTEDGTDVTYGQELVGTLVQYYSSWIDKINGKNNKVLNVVDETSDFYEEIESLEGDEDLEYGMNRLAIGEIRVGSTGFYVRTSVTIVDSKKKEQKEDHIVYIEPDEKAMKIVAVKKI